MPEPEPLWCAVGGFTLQMARRRIPGRLRAGVFAGVAVPTALAAGGSSALAGGGGGTGIGGGHQGGVGIAGHHRHHRHHNRHRHAHRHRRATGDADGPLAGQGMWIWYVNASNGGKIASIASQAHTYGIDTVFIKSSDGTNGWSQFTPGLVSALHARGLNVCAWQFVYGSHPKAEATLGADAKSEGADCLAIDAESQYEGRYRSASVYMHRLRNLTGRHFPIALASFPYVDYHPGLPYSAPAGRRRTPPRSTGTRSGPRRGPRSATPSSSTGSTGGRSSRSARPMAGRPCAR